MAWPIRSVLSKRRDSEGLIGRRHVRVVGLMHRHYLLVVLAVIFVVARVVILTRSRVLTTFDTSSYAPRGVPDEIQTFSLTGHAPRPWGVPGLFSLASTDQSRAVLQWGIGTAAWLLLIGAVWTLVASRTAQIVMAFAIAYLALTPSVYAWDFAILSESASINFGVLVLALLLIWTRSGSGIALALMTLVAFWWIFTRQDVLVFVALLVAVLAAYAWRSREHRWHTGIAITALLIGFAWNAAIQPEIEESFRSWWLNGYSLSEGATLYRLRLIVLPDPQVNSVYQDQFGMPSCPAAEAIARGDKLLIDAFGKAVRQCPDLVTWIDQNGALSGYRYAIADPGHYVHLLSATVPRMLIGPSDSSYVIGLAPLPGVYDAAFFPPADWTLPSILGVVASALVVFVGATALRRSPQLIVTGLILVACAIASCVITLMNAAGDYGRFGAQEAVFIRIGVILSAIAALDAAVTRISEVRPRPESATPSLNTTSCSLAQHHAPTSTCGSSRVSFVASPPGGGPNLEKSPGH